MGRITEVDEKSSVKPEEEGNNYDKSETVGVAETLASKINDQTKLTDSTQQDVEDEKKSTIDEPMKSKDETVSQVSVEKDRKSINKRISDGKKDKSPSKKSTTNASQRSPIKSSKISMTLSPTRPLPKTLKKIKDKNIKAKSKDTESTRSSQSPKYLASDVKTKDGDKFSSRVISKPDYSKFSGIQLQQLKKITLTLAVVAQWEGRTAASHS